MTQWLLLPRWKDLFAFHPSTPHGLIHCPFKKLLHGLFERWNMFFSNFRAWTPQVSSKQFSKNHYFEWTCENLIVSPHMTEASCLHMYGPQIRRGEAEPKRIVQFNSYGMEWNGRCMFLHELYGIYRYFIYVCVYYTDWFVSLQKNA